MDKINFVDYPSTTTPVSANNLNTMQTNIENEFTSMQSTFSTDIGANTDNIQANSTKIENLSIYSTTEVNTGMTWTNGKPIYRKVLSFTTSNTLNAFVGQAHGISNVDEFLPNISFAIKYNNGWYPAPNDIVIEIYANNTNFLYYNKSSNMANKPAYVILEYTKTTD